MTDIVKHSMKQLCSPLYDIISCLNDSGGHLRVRYTLDVNASMASENELQVDVEEYYPS